ncbi:hypothetical protein [uncultured Parabacteroides sp.]|uniref:hypothetical protein n=1 Tax=uncultured Parabacteroides sp. TaxID=512312 RepID=UPI0011C35A9D|nr:hypothetical protein [uncultured Parabacteroides sp.]
MKCRVKAIFCAPHGYQSPKVPWDIWSAVRFILLQAILRELSFITLSAFPLSGKQIVRFPEWAAHLISFGVSRRD